MRRSIVPAAAAVVLLATGVCTVVTGGGREKSVDLKEVPPRVLSVATVVAEGISIRKASVLCGSQTLSGRWPVISSPRRAAASVWALPWLSTIG